MKIAFDFDQTVCSKPTKYPQPGSPIPLAVKTLKELQLKNTLVLNTSRQGLALELAKKFLKDNEIEFELSDVNKTKAKLDVDIFIDDKNIGMKHDSSNNCDWVWIRQYLRKLKLL